MSTNVNRAKPVAIKIIISLAVIFVLTFLQQSLVSDYTEEGKEKPAIVINLIFPVLVFLGAVGFNQKYNHLSATETGFGFEHLFRNLILGVLTTVLIIGIVLFIAYLLGAGAPIFTALRNGSGLILLGSFASCSAIGAWEEIYFRGIVFNTILVGKYRFHFAVLITAILFTILHAGSYDMSQTTPLWFIVVILLSYLLTYLYAITRSIWTPIAFHTLWDFLWDLLDDAENTVGLVVVNKYRENAILLDNISIVALAVGIAITALLYRYKTKSILPAGKAYKLFQ